MVIKKNFDVIAIIQARAHHDKIDLLNMKEFGGKPLIYYTIEQAKKSKYINQIFLSTESKEIAEYGIKNGAKVKFFRPTKLVKKKVSTDEVVKDFIKRSKIKAKIIVTLLPNAPFRTFETIDKMIKLFKSKKNIDRIYSAKNIKTSIWGEKQKEFINIYNVEKQKKIFALSGGIIVSNMNFYFGKKKKVFYYIVNEIESLMIHSIFDLILADRLIDIDQTILMELVKSK